MDLGTLILDRVIVHEVPKPDEGDAPVLSEASSDSDREVEEFFVRRLAASVRGAGFDAVFQDAPTSPVPRAILELLRDPEEAPLVLHSRRMAEHLHGLQTDANSTGLLVAALGTVGGLRCVAILKVERQAGVLVEQDTTDRGLRKYQLAHIGNLLLSEKMRVFKSALFVHVGDELEDVLIRVTDDQMGLAGMAAFFLDRFLGCTFAGNPAFQTRAFINATSDLINTEITDSVDQMDLRLALTSEMARKVPTIDPRRFAREHVPNVLTQKFMERLGTYNCPRTPFKKDTAFVSNFLAKTRLAYKRGAVVITPPDELGKSVKVHQRGVDIRDDLKKLR